MTSKARLVLALALTALAPSACSSEQASSRNASGGSGAAASGGSSSMGGAGLGASAGSGSGGVSASGGGAGLSGAAGSSGSAGSGGNVGGAAGAAGASGSAGAAAGSGGTAGTTVVFGTSPGAANIADARAAYAAFKSSFFVDCGGKVRVTTGVNSQETFSEGMGYGLLMAAYLETDAAGPQVVKQLLDFVDLKRDASGLMHWKVSCADVWGQNAATDGDLDIALALIQAEKRWPGHGFGDGARAFLSAILATETDACGLKPGDAWGGCGGEANPSYLALGYFETFACFTGDSSWRVLRDTSFSRQLAYWRANYALPPDWVQVDQGAGSGRYSRGEYLYDAARVPLRVALDYLWHGKADARDQASAILGKIRSVSATPGSVVDGYDHQSGNPTGSNHNAVFLGPLAVAAMVDSANQAWLDGAYSELLAMQTDEYYKDALRVFSLMVLSGVMTEPCR